MSLETRIAIFVSIFAILCVSQYSSIFNQLLILDDLARYSEAMRNEFVLGIRFARTKVMPFINWPLTQIMSLSPAVARLLIVAIMVPFSFSLFHFFHVCMKISFIPSILLGTSPFITPGITLVPLTLSGSNMISGLFTFLLSFYFAKLFLNSNKYKYLFLQLLTYLIALECTEDVAPIIIPTIILLYFLRPDHWVIPISLVSLVYFFCAALKTVRTLAYPIGLPPVTPTSLSLDIIWSRITEWISWGFPFWELFGYTNRLVTAVLFLLSFLLFSTFLILEGKISGSIIKKKFAELQLNEKYLVITVCAFLWAILSFIPFSFSPFFSNRYGVVGVVGISLIFLLPFVYLFERYVSRSSIRNLVALCMLSITMAQANIAFNNHYKSGNMLTIRIRNHFKEMDLPSNSQIALLGLPLDNVLSHLRTAGYYNWSTGFLQWALSRKDLTGIVGRENTYYDPFVMNRSYSTRMQGLDIKQPLFVFRVDRENIVQMQYGLQWNSEDDWSVISFDLITGKITNQKSGSSDAELKIYIDELPSPVVWYWDADVRL